MRQLARLPVASASIGAILATAVMFVLGAATPQTKSTSGDPAYQPRRLVRIVEGSPFTVPPNKVLIVKELGWTGLSATGAPVSRLQVNGVDLQAVETPRATPIQSIGLGIVVASGDIVEPVSTGIATAVAQGVLMNY